MYTRYLHRVLPVLLWPEALVSLTVQLASMFNSKAVLWYNCKINAAKLVFLAPTYLRIGFHELFNETNRRYI